MKRIMTTKSPEVAIRDGRGGDGEKLYKTRMLSDLKKLKKIQLMDHDC